MNQKRKLLGLPLIEKIALKRINWARRWMQFEFRKSRKIIKVRLVLNILCMTNLINYCDSI